MKLRKKLFIGIASATLALGAGAGIAVAVWTVQGTGNGTAGGSVAQNLTVTAVTPTGSAASMYPGGGTGGVYFTVTNPNPFAVNVTGVSYGTPTSNNTTACPSADVSIDASAPSSVTITLLANSTSSTLSISGVLDMSHAAPNGCQGVSFNVPLTLSATQQ